MLLPELEVGLLEVSLSLNVELIEFVFEKFSHYSKARSIEKEVKLLVIFLRFCVGNIDFGLL